jgi:hypothetical protein
MPEKQYWYPMGRFANGVYPRHIKKNILYVHKDRYRHDKDTRRYDADIVDML